MTAYDEFFADKFGSCESPIEAIKESPANLPKIGI